MTSSGTSLCREVWLVRHGETKANAGRVIQGHTDIPLNDTGVRQAEQLAAWLKERRELGFTSVVTTPLSRAKRTASILASALGLPLHEEPRFMERNFGAWEGKSADEVYAAQDAREGDAFDFHPPGGESTHEMADRVTLAFDEWVRDGRLGARGLIVTHGGPIGALVCRALGLVYCADSIRRFKRDNTAVTVLRRKHDDEDAFVVDALNVRWHLPLD